MTYCTQNNVKSKATTNHCNNFYSKKHYFQDSTGRNLLHFYLMYNLKCSQDWTCCTICSISMSYCTHLFVIKESITVLKIHFIHRNVLSMIWRLNLARPENVQIKLLISIKIACSTISCIFMTCTKNLMISKATTV